MINRDRLLDDKETLDKQLHDTEQKLIAHKIEVDRLSKQVIYSTSFKSSVKTKRLKM